VPSPTCPSRRTNRSHHAPDRHDRDAAAAELLHHEPGRLSRTRPPRHPSPPGRAGPARGQDGPAGRRAGLLAAQPDWESAGDALRDELATAGRALVVGNTRHLSWSPAHGVADAPHWLLVRGHRPGRWLLEDHFAALTPHGEQEPFLGWVEDAELRAALTPIPSAPPEIAWRDRLALGEAVRVPPAGDYRWLSQVPSAASASGIAAPDGAPGEGDWLLDLTPTLSHVSAVLTADITAAERHADDLWAAGCHYAHRNTVLAAEGTVDPELAAAATVAWSELPKTLRFAVQSAARGRSRQALVERAFAHLVTATEAIAA
jgi:hypothetical protein